MDHERPATRVLAIGNQKGGVGKSTNAVHLAAALGERGRKVLIWDLDVNCGSTRHLGIPDGMNVFGTFEILTGAESPTDVIVRSGDIDDVEFPKNVDLLASHIRLEQLENALREQQSQNGNPFAQAPRPEDLLLEPIDSLRGEYDYVLLDTAPNLFTATKAAYRAADYFVLSTVLEPLAIKGLQTAMQYIVYAREAGNESLRLMGCIMSSVPGRITRLARELMTSVHQTFEQGDEFMKPFETYVNASTILPTLTKQGGTLFQEHPDHKITDQYRALAKELEERLSRLAATTREMEAVANG
ncbi:MAG: ParA family protein [Phycisphaerales bacterium]|nr:ParA family protein [Phycisphaerales bacterium]